MPLKTLRVAASPTSSVSRSSLVEPSTFSASTIWAMRRSTLAKSSMPIVGAIASPPGSGRTMPSPAGGRRRRRSGRLEQGVELLRVDALHQVLVGGRCAPAAVRASSQREVAIEQERSRATRRASAGSTGCR